MVELGASQDLMEQALAKIVADNQSSQNFSVLFSFAGKRVLHLTHKDLKQLQASRVQCGVHEVSALNNAIVELLTLNRVLIREGFTADPFVPPALEDARSFGKIVVLAPPAWVRFGKSQSFVSSFNEWRTHGASVYLGEFTHN